MLKVNVKESAHLAVLSLLLLFSFLYLNDYHIFHELYFYSSDLARSASVAKNLYTFGEYSTQTLPLLALDDYSNIPLSSSGYWLNSDRQPFSIFCISFLKTLFPDLSIVLIAQAYSLLTAVAVLLLVLYLARVVFASNAIWAVAILAMFPNFLVQIISKGGEDVFFFLLQFSALLGIVKHQNKTISLYLKVALYFAVVGVLYSRFYLQVFFLLPWCYIYFKYPKVRSSLIYTAVLSGISFAPWLYFNHIRFGELLYSVNGAIQLWFDLPMSYFSNTWWLYKLSVSEAPVSEIMQKSFLFIINNIKFFIINWTTALAALLICVRKWRYLTQLECFILGTCASSFVLSLVMLSPFAFSGAIIDYFIFLVPLFALLKIIIIRQWINGNLSLVEKCILLFTVLFYLVRKVYGLEGGALLFLFCCAIALCICFFRAKPFWAAVVCMLLFVREVPAWKGFASAFAIQNMHHVAGLPEFKNADLIFSLNGFWGITLITDAKVLPLPEKIEYIDEIASNLNVSKDKVVIVIGNPPKDVSQFKIPKPSQVYVNAYQDNLDLGSYSLTHTIESVKLWQRAKAQ